MRHVLIAPALLGLLACNKPQPAATKASAPPTTAPASGPEAAAPAAADTLRGKVQEKLEATPYTYLKLATANGEVWAAVPETNAAVGSEVAIQSPQEMRGFQSKTLNRTFDVVYFGTIASAPGGAQPGASPPGVAASQPSGPPQMPMEGAGAQHAAAGPAAGVGKIAKAAGPEGKTVEEIFAGKAALKDKSITINGQVVKFTSGVMGRNWIHLQDGSGAPDKATHDLTVTTQGEAKVGDKISVKGTLHADKDFGAGYSYAVIIEDATITPLP
ncbi:MAG: nucleotide-binding protein [Deltaproteobacteria bacterium]|nr:nucleotide-binding protein [Deltaproteobacteria bacterium]